jgi:hypothetical protein
MPPKEYNARAAGRLTSNCIADRAIKPLKDRLPKTSRPGPPVMPVNQKSPRELENISYYYAQ